MNDDLRQTERDEEMRLLLLQSRVESFAVEVGDARPPEVPNEMQLSVTHNGSAWQSIDLTPQEARMVIAALEKRLAEKAKGK